MKCQWRVVGFDCAPFAPLLRPVYTPVIFQTQDKKGPLRVTVTTTMGCHNGKHVTVLNHGLNGFSAGPRKHKQTRRHLRFFPSNGIKVSPFSRSRSFLREERNHPLCSLRDTDNYFSREHV